MPGVMQCASCGRTCTDGAALCPACGATLNGHHDDPLITRSMPAPAAPVHGRDSSQLGSSSTAEEEGRFIPGTLVAGRYRIIGLLGRGGMGEVYRATDLTLGQSVALKFLPEGAARDERLLERFHNEVRTARQVTHPNVCRVYDIGQADGHPFISMEYVDGEDLASLLQRIGRVPADKALEITRKICAGIAAAHDRGIVHRDLKPHNIMLNKRGDIVVMDFGLAAIADELHGPEARSGTLQYMAPEQLRGDSATAKSDLYSLGLIAYELFTGRRAFEAQTARELLEKEENTLPVCMTEIAPDVDRGIEDVVLSCLQPDPKMRPKSARAIAAALPGGDPLAAAIAAGEMPSPELVAASSRAQGMPLRYALACLGVVILGILAWPFILQSMPRMSLYAVAPMDFPPEVLAQKARDMAAEFGATGKRLDWASRFRIDSEMLRHVGEKRGNASWRETLAAASPVEFWYRQSPEYLLSRPDGSVQFDRPPTDKPGMVTAVLDSRGRLRYFQAGAPRYEGASSQATVNPAAVFTAAGLDITKFHEVTPSYAPPLAFDSRRAWTGAYPGLTDTEITVELATWRGAVTSFFIRWPWTKADAAATGADTRQTMFTLFYMAVLGLGLACAVFFARRNLTLGRGDRVGARRVAGAALLLSAVQSAALLHIIPVFDLVGFVFERLGSCLLFAAVVWVLYMALEPAVRARWPHTLITWNRLTAGDWKDPAVASHVLLGMALAVVWLGLLLVHVQWSLPGHPDGPDPIILSGGRALIFRLCMRMSNALLWGSAVFFLLCGVRALVRNDWVAIGVSSVVFTFVEGTVRTSTNLVVDVPLFVGLYVAFSFVLIRLGLIPAIVAIVLLNTLGDTPVGADFSAWFSWVATIQIGLIGACAIYAFKRSQAKVPVRGALTALRQSSARAAAGSSR